MNTDIQILIVDDDPDLLFATARVIQSAGYEVLTAETGAEGMASVRQNRPDLILLDVILPDTDGHDMCRQLKQDPELHRIFVVLISGTKTESAEQADGLDVGADGYIARPITNRELLARVNSMVRILRAEKERDQLIVQLEEALARVKKLSGLLPICAGCKKIRDDKGYWNQIESYIYEHSDAILSHGICPKCAEKYYPNITHKSD
jgi:DNA-binding response OmpR family regulator